VTALSQDVARAAHAVGPALEDLRRWLSGPRIKPLADDEKGVLGAAIDDLDARVRQWQNEPMLLTVVLLGGTGAGKSTLLNALAGKAIAAAGLVRPTTQFATVYHHQDVRPERLDPRFRHCRLVSHDRMELRHKILVDTPDMDGNVAEHHERLKEILPLADAVLYIGSQEKYHDREGWRILMDHRRTRGFAFVLNKWDRCLPGAGDRSGTRPDEDFKRSLHEAGFSDPLLFRTVASQWALRRLYQQEPDEDTPDDFPKLESWLDVGLREQAIRAIKVLGISARLDDLIEKLRAALPQEWNARAAELKGDWEEALEEHAQTRAESLLEAADRHASFFDAHFRQLDHRDYGGVFGWYLSMVGMAAKVRRSLRPQLAMPTLDLDFTGSGPLAEWAKRTLAETPPHVREAPAEELSRQLLALANRRGWPVPALEQCLPAPREVHGGDRRALAILSEEAADLEKDIRTPSGAQYTLRAAYRLAAYWLPPIVFFGVVAKWLYDAFFGGGTLLAVTPILFAILLTVATLMALHAILTRVLPMQWRQLRGRMGKGIERRLLADVAPPYLASLDKFSARVAEERALAAAPLSALEEFQRSLGQAQAAAKSSALFARTDDD
jgi:energy-coupling factor transporter ATP-binding protein EcfA2